MSDQQLGHLVVSVGTGVMEGDQPAAEKDTALLHYSPLDLHGFASSARQRSQTCSAPFVLGVHVGPVVQQVLHHRHSVVTGGEMQRSGVAALQIPTVHILSRAQRLQGGRRED